MARPSTRFCRWFFVVMLVLRAESAGSEGASSLASSAMMVRFWGVRGSIACPGPRTMRYGGNTACVEIRCGEQLFIFDSGSGLRLLGDELIKGGHPRDFD